MSHAEEYHGETEEGGKGLVAVILFRAPGSFTRKSRWNKDLRRKVGWGRGHARLGNWKWEGRSRPAQGPDKVGSVGNSGCPDHLRLLPAQRLQRNKEKLPMN